MAGGKISGIALGSVFTGSVFLYAGIRGKSVPGALQLIIQGRDPRAAAAANPITGTSPAAAAADGGTTPSGPGDTGAHGAGAAANQALTRLMVTLSHPTWGTGQEWADWVSLWNQESGWNNLALNPSSGAFGIAQALGHGSPGTGGKYGNQYGASYGLSVAQAIAANNGSPAPQIEWGIGYIASAYGSPSAAWAHEQANNWY